MKQTRKEHADTRRDDGRRSKCIEKPKHSSISMTSVHPSCVCHNSSQTLMPHCPLCVRLDLMRAHYWPLSLLTVWQSERRISTTTRSSGEYFIMFISLLITVKKRLYLLTYTPQDLKEDTASSSKAKEKSYPPDLTYDVLQKCVWIIFHNNTTSMHLQVFLPKANKVLSICWSSSNPTDRTINGKPVKTLLFLCAFTVLYTLNDAETLYCCLLETKRLFYSWFLKTLWIKASAKWICAKANASELIFCLSYAPPPPSLL